MLTTSQNYTLDEREASLRFVFPHQEHDFSISGVVVVGVFSVIAFPILILTIISYPPLQILPEPIESLPTLGMIWLIALSLGILFYVETLWRRKGKEFVEINHTGISIRHQTLGFKRTKYFSAQNIDCLFSSRRKDNGLLAALTYPELRFFSSRRGTIAFNSGKTHQGRPNTLRFAAYINPEETRQIVALIHQKFPQYRCHPGPTVWS